MKTICKLVAIGALLLGLMCSSAATPSFAAENKTTDALPAQKGYVNDFVGLLSAGATKNLEASLKEYREKSRVHLVVVIMKMPTEVQTCSGSSCDYAQRFIKDWGIGSGKEDHGGVVLVVFPGTNSLLLQPTPSIAPFFANPDARNSFYLSIAESVMEKDSQETVMKGLSSLMNIFNPPRQQARR